MPEYVNHPEIKENTLERRKYQESIAKSVLNKGKNSLIVLPTGAGKTEIAILIMAELLNKRGPKILLLAPTRPLVNQHAERLKKYLKNQKIVSITGTIKKEQRKELYENNDIIVSTPQVIENDISSNIFNPDEIKLLIVDEAHRSVGKYAYTYVTEKCKNALIIGLTASPGSDEERLKEIMQNLHIENVEIRTESDEDVTPYIHGVKIEVIKLEFPSEFEPMREKLREIISKVINEIEEKYPDINIPKKLTKGQVVELQKSIWNEIQNGNKSFYPLLSYIGIIMKMLVAIEYLETQDPKTSLEYLEEIYKNGIEKKNKGDMKLSKMKEFVDLIIGAKYLVEKSSISPKIKVIGDIILDQLKRNPKSRIIVFTNYRNINMDLYNYLSTLPGVKPSRFLGQSSKGSDKGMSQKEQIKILEMFKNGEINVLISTQIGEEGLDIPETDLVIFHEAVGSEIRNIQRRGRTGRARPGRVVFLIYEDTMDENMYYASLMKEKKMKSKLKNMSKSDNKLNRKNIKGQSTLFDFL